MDSRKGNRPPARGERGSGRDAPGGGKRKRKRRRGQGPKQPDGAAGVLSKKSKPVDLRREPVEEPLSPREVGVLREHFKFLRENRKELRLKVNGVEDLLLNGGHASVEAQQNAASCGQRLRELASRVGEEGREAQ